MAASLMGVLRTRYGPVLLRQTLGDAERTAGRNVLAQQVHRRVARQFLVERAAQNFDEGVLHSAQPGIAGERRRAVHVIEHGRRIRPRRRAGALHRLQHLALAALADGVELFRGDAVLGEMPLQALDRAFLANLGEFLLGPVLLRVADVVSRHAKGHALEQIRAGAAAQSLDRVPLRPRIPSADRCRRWSSWRCHRVRRSCSRT